MNLIFVEDVELIATPFFQRLASILYKAAAEHGYVDPEKIRTALGIFRKETAEAESKLGMLILVHLIRDQFREFYKTNDA